MANPVEKESPPLRVQVELIPPKEKEEPPPPGMEKFKQITGKILIVIGLILLAAALFTMAGHVIGFLTIGAGTAEMLFASSVVGIVAGYYLADPKRTPQSVYIGTGNLGIYA